MQRGFSVVEWWLCSREWLLTALTPSCICLLVSLTVCLTTWCRARYQILIPLPSQCVCPWVWLTGCSRLSYGTTAERWETTGTAGLQPYKGLNSNVLLLILPHLFPLLSQLQDYASMFMNFSFYYQECINFLLLASFFCWCFLVFFFFWPPRLQRSRETASCTLWLGLSFDHSGEKASRAFLKHTNKLSKNFQELHNHSQPHSIWPPSPPPHFTLVSLLV